MYAIDVERWTLRWIFFSSQNLADYIPSRYPLIRCAIQVPRKAIGYPREHSLPPRPPKYPPRVHWWDDINVMNCPPITLPTQPHPLNHDCQNRFLHHLLPSPSIHPPPSFPSLSSRGPPCAVLGKISSHAFSFWLLHSLRLGTVRARGLAMESGI